MASARTLANEINARNHARAASHDHDQTYGSVPSILYRESEGSHGNFFPAAWRAIQKNPAWRSRLEKTYTGSNRIARGSERWRGELECATSSDALLMNIFCTPATLGSIKLRALLNLSTNDQPDFGWRSRTPLQDDYDDRTEIDMRLGDLLIEAKLCEGDFQTGRADLMARYPLFEETFDTEVLPRKQKNFLSYQLLRGVMAAVEHDARFCLMCDGRRPDLISRWFNVLSAVRSSSVRCRLQLVTWQEIALCLPHPLQSFLATKYGIGEGDKIESDDSYT
ncbi:PGN_0703 family putative restriction endonuclease [Terriglobus saanensis]|uniref:Uncharacterized protein n=1 Tax=Terriglobus saanensis (strain ATCC BAA-1853 / DSM 23119 / SP1PR4) TaxID=401053 RepID=E8V4U7_TERSS|nr:hypothetical protein [Terriglobus saanensis]ADV82575.1 hypothetical protein AciPR4_1769 [Terriglobus saanensis SP1PR4]